MAAALWLVLVAALAGSRGALAACNVTAKVVIVSQATLGPSNASAVLASGADAVAAAALAFQSPPAQLAAASVCASLLAEASDGTEVSLTASLERLRADPSVTAAIAVLPQQNCPALSVDLLPVVCVGTVVDRSALGMASSTESFGAAAAALMAGLEVGRTALVFGDDLAGRSAATAFATSLSSVLTGRTEVAAWLQVAGANEAPWSIVPYLSVARINSSQPLGRAKAALPPGTTDADAQSALHALKGIEAVLQALATNPLLSGVAMAASWEASSALMTEAHQRGLLAGAAWVDLVPVPSPVPVIAAGNVTVSAAVRQATRGRLSLVASPSTTSAGQRRRDAIRTTWAGLPSWRTGLSPALNNTRQGLLEGWAAHGLASSSGTAGPDARSLWQSSHDAAQAILFALGRACAGGASTCDAGSGEVTRSVLLRAMMAASRSSGDGLVPSPLSALGGSPSPTLLGASSGMDIAVVNHDASSEDPASWPEVARWRATGVVAAADPTSSQVVGGPVALAPVGLLVPAGANSSAAFEATPAMLNSWYWPGAGTGNAPDLHIVLRVGLARRLSLNETDTAVASALAGMRNLSVALPRVLVHFTSDELQLEMSEFSSSTAVVGGGAAGNVAKDTNQLVTEAESLASRQFDVIVMVGDDDTTAAAAEQLATLHPRNTFLILRDGASAAAQLLTNLVTVVFSDDQPSFVAGATAAATALARAGRQIELPGVTPNTGTVKRSVTGLDLDGDGIPDSPGGGVLLAMLHGPLTSATLRRVTSGFASGVRQLCPGCQLLDAQMLDSSSTTIAVTVQQGRAAAEALASRPEAPSVVLVSAVSEAVAAAAMEELAHRGVMTVAPTLAALAAARAALQVSAPTRLPMLLGSLQKTAAEVVQLVALQRSAANAAARSAPASSGAMAVSARGASAWDLRAEARQNTSAGHHTRRRLAAGPTAGQVVTVGLQSGAVSFALGDDLDSSTGSEFLSARVAARAAHAWARAGLLSGELETEVFLTSGAPFLQPTSCEIGEEFRQGAGGDPSLAQCFKCPQTTYSLTRGGTCKPCPEQGVCEGGAHLAARYGHWVGQDLQTIYSCNAYSCCIEGNCSHPDNPALTAEDRTLALATRCNNGRDGILCGSCPSGELLVSEANGCGKCNAVQWIPVGLFLGGCAAFVMYMLIRNHDVRSASFSIAVDFLNSALLVFSPARQFGFTISFGAATMELTAAPFSRDCIVPMTPLMRLMSPFAIPVAFLVTLFVAWLFTVCAKSCCNKCRKKQLNWGGWRSQMVLWVIITIAYSAFSRVGIEALTCRTVDGVEVVATAPDIVCSGVPYYVVASTTGVVAFATLFGIPVLVFYSIYTTLKAMDVLKAGTLVFRTARVAKLTTRAIQKLTRGTARAQDHDAAEADGELATGTPAIQDKAPAGGWDTSQVRAPSPTAGTPLPAGTRRSSLAWEAELAQLRAEALDMELEAHSAPARDGMASSRSRYSARSVVPRSPGDALNRQRRRLSALGLAPDQRGWILDSESNGYFWLFGEVGKAPLGPFFVHPRYAAKSSSGGRGSKKDPAGTGRRVAWSLIPESRVDAAISAANKLGSTKGLAVVIEPKSGQLVAINFQRPPPAKQLRMLSRQAMSAASDDGGSTTGSLAWAERSPGEHDRAIGPRSASQSPSAAAGAARGKKSTTPEQSLAGLRGSGTSRMSSSSGVAREQGSASAAGVKLERSVTGPAAPAAGRRGRGRRGSILNDPEKLRQAMALQGMVGRTSGAEMQLKKLVEEARGSGSESGDDAGRDDDVAAERHGDDKAQASGVGLEPKPSARTLRGHASKVRNARKATARGGPPAPGKMTGLATSHSTSPRAGEAFAMSPRPPARQTHGESMVLRLDDIPPGFRGSARLFIPFRQHFRATGYATLLLRRGLATLAYVLLSQQPAIKQAILFLYFMGWLLWQITQSPFQEALDNKFASVSLAVIVSTAGLELNFISQVVGPSWVTWTQLVLLAIPVGYIIAIMRHA